MGIVAVIILCVVGVVGSFAGGMTIDLLMDQLQDAEMFDVPARWSMMDHITYLIDISYAYWYLTPVLGVVILFAFVIIRQQYDQYYYYDDYYR